MKRPALSALVCGTLAAAMVTSAGAVSLYIDQKPLESEVPAQIINNRTMVPIGPIFNALGAEMTWDQGTKTATGYKGDTTVKIQIDNATAYVNDKAVTLDTPAMIVNNRTMVPAWFVSEALGAKVTWDGATSTVWISTTQAPATTGQKNALEAAKRYIKYSPFSRKGLISQLEYEKYSTEDAIFAADNCGADWKQQAVLSAKRYISYSAFSYSGLIDQLEYEGYTHEQAVYGTDSCEANWDAEAVEAAAKYLKYTSFSRDSLIDQLEFDGFTHEQAVHGVESNGY